MSTKRPLVFLCDGQRLGQKIEIPLLTTPIGLYNSERFTVLDAIRLRDTKRIEHSMDSRGIRRIFYTSHSPKLEKVISDEIKIEKSEHLVCKSCFFKFDDIAVVNTEEDVPAYFKRRGQSNFETEFILKAGAKRSATVDKLEKLGFKKNSDFAFLLDKGSVQDPDAALRLVELSDSTRRLAGSIVYRSGKQIAATKQISSCPLCGHDAKRMKSAPTTLHELAKTSSPRLKALSALANQLSIASTKLTTVLTIDNDEITFLSRFCLGVASLRDGEILLVEEPFSSSKSAEIFAVLEELAQNGTPVIFTSPSQIPSVNATWIDCGASEIHLGQINTIIKGNPRDIVLKMTTSCDPGCPVADLLELDLAFAELFSRQTLAKAEGYSPDDFFDFYHPAGRTRLFDGYAYIDLWDMTLRKISQVFSKVSISHIATIATALGIGDLKFYSRAVAVSPRQMALITVAFALSYPPGSRIKINNLQFLTSQERQEIGVVAKKLRIQLS